MRSTMPALLAQVIGVEDHLDLRAGNRLQQGQGLVERGQKGPFSAQPGCMGSMARVTPNSAARGANSFRAPCDQPPGMVEGVAGPGPAVDHQACRFQGGGGAQGLGGVFDALAVAAAVAAGESARPKQVRDLQAAARAAARRPRPGRNRRAFAARRRWRGCRRPRSWPRPLRTTSGRWSFRSSTVQPSVSLPRLGPSRASGSPGPDCPVCS